MKRFLSIFNITNLFFIIIPYRELLYSIICRNINGRYKETTFGIIWIFITPIMQLLIYTFVFSVVFQAKWGGLEGSKAAFSLVILCGMTVYNLFAESITYSINCIVGNPSYVKKILFPLELLPICHAFTALYFCGIWLLILLIGSVLVFHTIPLAVLSLPMILLPLFLLSMGCAFFMASLGVYFRDLSYIVGIVLQMLYFVTPIFYSYQMVPSKFRILMLLNPLTYFVNRVRGAMFYSEWPNMCTWGIIMVCSILFLQIGVKFFQYSKEGFADVL